MKRFSYSERDYAFGQHMMTLRTSIGLTQAGLAQHLGVSRKAVGGWEAGDSYPKVEHLKALIILALRASAFAAGREEEEIRALWQVAHQKVLLDEAWLAAVLNEPSPPPALVPLGESSGAEEDNTSLAPINEVLPAPPGQRSPSLELANSKVPAASGPRVDWGEALDVPSFYGRAGELTTLGEWMVQDRCRVVSVLGQGGIGKSALATQMMHRVAEDFEVVIWRSLRDVPTYEALLDDCLQVLAPQALRDPSASLESRQNLLLDCLRSQRGPSCASDRLFVSVCISGSR